MTENLPDNTKAEPAGGEAGEPQGSFPLGVGNFEDQVAHDPLAGDGGSRKRLDNSTLLIVVVILVAAGGLFAMRTLARITIPTASAGELEQTIESFLKMLSIEDPADGSEVDLTKDPVLDVIAEDYTDRQVPLADVQRNPFIIWAPLAAPQQGDGETNSGVDRLWKEKRAEREREIRAAGERFQLKSVLMGSTPLANLNDKIVRQGESVLVEPEIVEFQVTSISPDLVTLVAVDARFDLIVEIQIELQRD
ncbi:MAG: hypothetical protein ACYTGC_05480 [Planctomycetota bacterium]